MRNYLAHEIGHIYGLRHEFAKKERNPSVQFGPTNTESVMNYNDIPVIQESDRIWLQKLYNPNERIFDFQVERIFPFPGPINLIE